MHNRMGHKCHDLPAVSYTHLDVYKRQDNACGLGDKRVSIYYEDGLKFLRLKQNEYDLIINDAIDPLGHNAGLFTKEFYGNCYRALKEDGIMVYQHGSCLLYTSRCV